MFEQGPAVMGHRGMGKGTVGGHVENTMASYLAAAELTDWIELDVQRCADDELMVYHNPATPDGRFLLDQTSAELAARGVLRLADVLAELPERVSLDVDVKTPLEEAVTPRDRGTAALLAPVLAKELHRRRLFATSFDPATLLELREAVPDLPLCLVTWLAYPIGSAIAAAARLGVQIVGLHTLSFGPSHLQPDPSIHYDHGYAVDVAHRAGLEVLTWCPSPEEAVPLVRAGVDCLCVNDVPGVIAALDTV
ncbi:MAG: glycerophosphodiester phosphodiesterase [Actinocatenispora sp.]